MNGILKTLLRKFFNSLGYVVLKKENFENFSVGSIESKESDTAAGNSLVVTNNRNSTFAKKVEGTSALRSPVMDEYSKLKSVVKNHAAGAFPTNRLRMIEQILPSAIKNSAETGCGKSTVLFSNLSETHKVFALDDRQHADSSVNFFSECPLTKNDRIEIIFGPTQETLLNYNSHETYDVVLIDGPHGFPFPEMEYYFFYPHIREGGFLIIDDVNIPTIGRLADFVAEDDMFDLIDIIDGTAVFKRTSAPVFDPKGDGWWEQKFNRRRVSPKREIFLDDGPAVDIVSLQKLDRRIYGE
jgi:hypothetical protein